MAKRHKILILYTGGTIGMKPTDEGYKPDPEFPDHIRKDIGAIQDSQLPEFDIQSMDPLLDSSNMNPDNWDRIAEIVDKERRTYKGFVILHGTDTMAYTASALGFMLSGINNNVIITGSQVPYNRLRNDARENLISSLIIAGNYSIPEVVLYFNNKLLRGCRSTKVNASGFDAFESPNYPPLADIGIDISLKKHWDYSISLKKNLIQDKLKRTRPVEYFRHDKPQNEAEIGVLKLFPGISARYVSNMLTPELQGLVIEAYGAGNGPTKKKNPEFHDALKQASESTILVAVTQCLRGSVHLDSYAASLKSAGVISGRDMTLEAAVTKLYYLISKKRYNLDKVRQVFQTDLIGEMTE